MTEIRRTTACDANATVSLQPDKYVSQLQSYFEAFAVHVAERFPKLATPFRRASAERFRMLTTHGESGEDRAAIRSEDSKKDGLQQSRLAYILKLLGVADVGTEEVRVTRFAATQARLYPMYYQVLTLSDLMGRRETIDFVESYIDRWMSEHTQADEALEDPGRFWDNLEGPTHETAEIATRIHRGKIAFRVNDCLWANVMRPLGDPELAHTFTCYGDFSQILTINPNFVLTRTVTVMQGGPYCDTCIHDKRFVDAIEHPSREFYDGLGEGQ